MWGLHSVPASSRPTEAAAAPATQDGSHLAGTAAAAQHRPSRWLIRGVPFPEREKLSLPSHPARSHTEAPSPGTAPPRDTAPQCVRTMASDFPGHLPTVPMLTPQGQAPPTFPLWSYKEGERTCPPRSTLTPHEGCGAGTEPRRRFSGRSQSPRRCLPAARPRLAAQGGRAPTQVFTRFLQQELRTQGAPRAGTHGQGPGQGPQSARPHAEAEGLPRPPPRPGLPTTQPSGTGADPKATPSVPRGPGRPTQEHSTSTELGGELVGSAAPPEGSPSRRLSPDGRVSHRRRRSRLSWGGRGGGREGAAGVVLGTSRGASLSSVQTPALSSLG